MDVSPIIYEFALRFIEDVTPGRVILVPQMPRENLPNYIYSPLQRMLVHGIEMSSSLAKYQFWFSNKTKNLANFKMLAQLSTSYFLAEHNFVAGVNPAFCEHHFTECLADFCVEIAVFNLSAYGDNIKDSSFYSAMCIVYALNFFRNQGKFTYRTWIDFNSWGSRRKYVLDAFNPRSVDFQDGDSEIVECETP